MTTAEIYSIRSKTKHQFQTETQLEKQLKEPKICEKIYKNKLTLAGYKNNSTLKTKTHHLCIVAFPSVLRVIGQKLNHIISNKCLYDFLNITTMNIL